MELRGLPLQGFPVALLKDKLTRIKAGLLEVSIKDNREKWVSGPVSSSPNNTQYGGFGDKQTWGKCHL